MLNHRLARLVAGFLAAAALLVAQKPKSQKEVDAIMAMQSATTADARIQAANALLTKFADTEFKSLALYYTASSYREKNDHTNTIVFAEQVVDADPKSAFGGHARVLIASALAATTKEFDLDREEKLGRADKTAKEAIEVLKVAPKFNPGIPDDQWEGIRKDYISEANAALGMSATVRKNWPAAIAAYTASISGAANPDPASMVRLAAAYNQAGKFDDAIATVDKISAMADVHPTIKQVAQAEKEKAVKAKGGK